MGAKVSFFFSFPDSFFPHFEFFKSTKSYEKIEKVRKKGRERIFWERRGEERSGLVFLLGRREVREREVHGRGSRPK